MSNQAIVAALLALAKALDRKGALSLTEYGLELRAMRSQVPDGDPDSASFDAMLDMINGEIASGATKTTA